MKKLNFSFIVLLFSIFVSSQAFALECKQGNYGSDECWTTAQLRETGENIANLLPGTVMEWDYLTPTQHGIAANTPARLSFYVRAAGATTDNHLVAGVYQGTTSGVESGDRVQLLVRGKGLIRANGAVETKDRFYVAAQSGTGNFGEARTLGGGDIGTVATQTNDKVIAWALETTTAAETMDAYITIV